MIRKLFVALAALALTLPLAVVPVAAHTGGGFTIDYSTYTDGDGTHVVGTIQNHYTTRRSAITITGTWTNGTTPVATENLSVPLTNLAPHASWPFHLVEASDVSAATTLTVTATSSSSGVLPSGGLYVEGSLTDTVGGVDTITGTVENDGTAALTNVRVYAVRADGTTELDAGESANIAALAAGATAAFTITLDRDVEGGAVTLLTARSTSNPYYTSWNNYFGDLGTTSFRTEIEYLAHAGITIGCGTANYCPTASVTREQMAIFLDRALGLPDAPLTTQFTDIAGRTLEARQAISNLVAAEITNGCAVDKFCPTATTTRGQMSKFVAIGYELPAAVGNHFTDDNGNFSEPYNNQIFEAGISTGCGGGKFCHLSVMTRETMASWLYNAETP